MQHEVELKMTLEELAEKLEPHWAEYQTYKKATIGEGWADLVSDLVDDLEKVDPDFKVVQVKEKFGGLRFYVDYYISSEETESGSNKEARQKYIRSLVSAAEAKSYLICEDCGEPGSTSSIGYWIVTLCENCKIKIEEERENG